MQLFGQLDYAQVSLRDIATHAGVSLRLIFYHFGTKEQLRDAVDQYALESLRNLASPVLELPPADRLAALIDGAAIAGAGRALTLYVRRMLLDDSPRGHQLLDGVIAQLYAAFEQPGDPTKYTSEERHHEIAMISLMLGGVLLKPQLDRRYQTDVHGPSERDGRLAAYAPLVAAGLRLKPTPSD